MTNFSFQTQTLHLLYLLHSEASKWTNNNKQNHFWVEGGLCCHYIRPLKRGLFVKSFFFTSSCCHSAVLLNGCTMWKHVCTSHAFVKGLSVPGMGNTAKSFLCEDIWSVTLCAVQYTNLNYFHWQVQHEIMHFIVLPTDGLSSVSLMLRRADKRIANTFSVSGCIWVSLCMCKQPSWLHEHCVWTCFLRFNNGEVIVNFQLCYCHQEQNNSSASHRKVMKDKTLPVEV